MNAKNVCYTTIGIPQIFIDSLKSIASIILLGMIFTTATNAQVKVVPGGNVGIKTGNPSQALEVDGMVKINQFISGTEMLIGQDLNGVLTTLGIGTGLQLDGDILSIDPSQVGGNAWNLDGNNAGPDDFIGTTSESTETLKFKVGGEQRLAIDLDGRLIPSFNSSNGLDNAIIGNINTGNINTGSSNNFIGPDAGQYSIYTGSATITQATANNYIGLSAGAGTSANSNTGSNNNFIGRESGRNNTTGSNNNYIGRDAGMNSGNASWNNFIGLESGKHASPSGSNSIGYRAGFYDVGLYNNYIGWEAGRGNASDTCDGGYNNFMGYRSGRLNTGGEKNVFLGHLTGSQNSSGSENVFIGSSAGSGNNSGSENVYIGKSSGAGGQAGSENVFIGSGVGIHFALSGSGNVFIGLGTGDSNQAGSNNVFLGTDSGDGNTGGSDNIFLGVDSGHSNSIGSKNIYLGFESGYNNTSGSSNIAIGNQADFATIDGNEIPLAALIETTTIGYKALVNANNKIRLGSQSMETIVEGYDFFETSDSRFKKDVNENVPGIEFIKAIKPVTYKFDTRLYDEHLMQFMADSTKMLRMEGVNYEESSSTIHTGFLAQDVEAACLNLGFNFDGVHPADPNNPTSTYALSYSSFVVPLVQAVKEQQVIIEELQNQKESQDQLITDLIKRIEALENK